MALESGLSGTPEPLKDEQKSLVAASIIRLVVIQHGCKERRLGICHYHQQTLAVEKSPRRSRLRSTVYSKESRRRRFATPKEESYLPEHETGIIISNRLLDPNF